MVKDGLIGQLKNGFKKIVLVTGVITLLSSLSGCPGPLPINNIPKAELSAYPLSGQAPLEVTIPLNGTDLDGKKDIIQYKIGEDKNDDGDIEDYNELIKSSSNPINEKVIFNTPGIKKIYGQVMDSKGAIGKAGPISIDVSPAPGSPTVDLSEVNTDLLEEVEKVITLPLPTDPNAEDNPVPYISATSLDGKVSIDNSLLNQNKIIVTGNLNEINTYQINLEFGSLEGSINNATLEGSITNLVDISGQLQENETDSPQAGIIRAYDSSTNFLKEIQTNSSGNFDFQLNDIVSEIILQARIMDGSMEKSYVRTIKGLSGLQDHGNIEDRLIVRAIPYDGPDPYDNGLIDIGSGGQISISDFKLHMRYVMSPAGNLKTNPKLLKWDFGEFFSQYPFTELIISKNNPDLGIGGTFTDTEIDNIILRILDSNDVGSLFEGKIQESQISVIDNYLGGGSGGKILLFPAEKPVYLPGTTQTVAGYAYVFDENSDGYIDSVRLTVGVPLDGGGLESSVLPHEFTHGSGLIGHSNLSQTVTVTNEIGSGRIIFPSSIDKKSYKIVNDDKSFGEERHNDLMGDDFIN